MKANFLAYVLYYAVLIIGDGFGFTMERESKDRQKRATVLSFNDPLYPQQFYLNDRFGVTMNIKKVWAKGYTGKNVTICISDPSGAEYTHDDLFPRFNLAGSYNYDLNRSDPSPAKNSAYLQMYHGTAMAGLAAGQANNGKCGVGVAYDANISAVNDGIRAADKTRILAAALAFKNQINDIYSCSWGTVGFFADLVGYTPPVIKASLKNGAEKGRGGKGNIYVFANGNEQRTNGTCSYSEFISSIYTISISVVTGKNEMTKQDVLCTGVSAVTYGRDGSQGTFGQNPHDAMPTCALNNTCKDTTASSSASTAVASGMFALVLQANPNLGWRDLQHLIARTSSSGFPTVTWKTNKAGIRVSDAFGFGLLDADALVENAKNWTNVGQHLECTLDYNVNERIDGVDTTVKSIDLTSWPANCGGESQRIYFLEHVLLVVSFNYTWRYYVEIEVEAPTGTKSIILRSGRYRDFGKEVKDLSVLSLHHWGENPKGIWTMRLRNVKPNIANSGNLFRWGFKFYGTKDDPLASNTVTPSEIRRSFINTTTTKKPPVTPKNTASQSNSGTSPTVSGIWTKPNATTLTINGTTGTAMKVPTTTTKNGRGSTLKCCKSTYLAAAILVLSLFWNMNC